MTLYALSIETLANCIKYNENIRGIKIPNTENLLKIFPRGPLIKKWELLSSEFLAEILLFLSYIFSDKRKIYIVILAIQHR